MQIKEIKLTENMMILFGNKVDVKIAKITIKVKKIF